MGDQVAQCITLFTEASTVDLIGMGILAVLMVVYSFSKHNFIKTVIGILKPLLNRLPKK